jgi:hypothetical protein
MIPLLALPMTEVDLSTVVDLIQLIIWAYTMWQWLDT